jgi:hypothetical protein
MDHCRDHGWFCRVGGLSAVANGADKAVLDLFDQRYQVYEGVRKAVAQIVARSAATTINGYSQAEGDVVDVSVRCDRQQGRSGESAADAWGRGR